MDAAQSAARNKRRTFFASPTTTPLFLNVSCVRSPRANYFCPPPGPPVQNATMANVGANNTAAIKNIVDICACDAATAAALLEAAGDDVQAAIGIL